jgi:4-amino-4-deoxy-L-arabinose transferase-like glycosyltransferase
MQSKAKEIPGFLSMFLRTRIAHPVLNRKPQLELLFLFLLCTAALLVRIWGISKCHFWDEWVYLQNAEVICCGKVNYSELDFRPPLISVIYAGVFLLWHHLYAACIAAAFLNALGPVFLYLAGRVSVGRAPAAIAALLLAYSPFFVGIFPNGFDSDNTGNSLLTDSPALTLVVVGLWLLLRALRRQSTFRFASAGFVLALCILMRFGTLPSVGMLFLLTFAAPRRWKAIVACGLGLLAGMAPYLLWSRISFGSFLHTMQASWANVEGPEESFFFFFRNSGTIFTPVAVLGLLLFASYWLWRVLKDRQQFRELFVAPLSTFALQAYLWIWLLLGFLFFSDMPHKEPRYILPIAPPFLMLASSGLALLCTVPRRSARIAGTTIVAAALLITFLPLRERFGSPFVDSTVPEEMVASQFLQASLPPRTTLYMNFNYPVFAFFTSFRIHELPAAGPALYSGLEQMPRGDVFIAYRETEGGEPRIEWVDANRKFECIRRFSAFSIYRRSSTETQW